MRLQMQKGDIVEDLAWPFFVDGDGKIVDARENFRVRNDWELVIKN